MHDVVKRLGVLGVVPVVKIEKASDAVALGKALLAGDLPVAEITFRTAAAEQAIAELSRACPELLVGAGTILTAGQVDVAVAAGAKFIVTPGFNARVVDYCIAKGVPVTPGVNTPTDVEMGIERGLDVLKFFPAGASGGLEYLKALSGPYGGVQFIPTGGIEASNLREYLSFNRVHAVGGTWIAREAAISAGAFDEIARKAREAVQIALGFELAHIGVNEPDAGKAMADAELLSRLFTFAVKDGTSSTFAGAGFELLKSPFLGAHGHIAVSTLSIPRAIAHLARLGVGIKPETAKEKEGRTIAVYLDKEVGGFALHLLQK